jgi:hypothetical protein
MEQDADGLAARDEVKRQITNRKVREVVSRQR